MDTLILLNVLIIIRLHYIANLFFQIPSWSPSDPDQNKLFPGREAVWYIRKYLAALEVLNLLNELKDL